MRGQVSMEILVAVALLCLFFLFALWLSGEINASAYALQDQGSQWDECLNVSRLIQEVFAQGPGTQVQTSLSYPAVVSSRTVYLPDISCDFSAAASMATLSAGTVTLYNRLGIVVLRNE